MVQALASPTASLDLIPGRIPDVNLADGIALSAATDDGTAGLETASLLLLPGEASEVLLRLNNPTDRPITFTLHLEGNIPDKWCLTLLGAESGTDTVTCEVAARGRKEMAIAFQVPADFFETLTDAAPGERRPLNYSGRIDLYGANPDGVVDTILSEPLTLVVRPHSPYVRLLPQVYQDIDFVGRLMAIVERTFRPDVETWSSLWAYLDPKLAPEAMLPFLAHWVGWRRLPQLSWPQQRRLMSRAIELYTWRGTAYGLRLYLHLATGLPLDNDDTPEDQKHISIVEPSRQGAVFGGASFSSTTVFGRGQDFHFVVILRVPEALTVDEALVHSIIDQERPAFCTYDLRITPMSSYNARALERPLAHSPTH
ncbi:MAG: phage tail protein [Cyanobacteria bacterium P01_F01_bin.150]